MNRLSAFALRYAGLIRALLIAVPVLFSAVSATAGQNDDAPADPPAPRMLVLVLDGVPFRVVEAARERGAFAGWPQTLPMVSTFPSMTNVAFAALLRPLGETAVPGYELRHFDHERNRIVKADGFAWKDRFQVISHTKSAKAGVYITTRKKIRRDMTKVEKLALESPSELMLAHVAATDTLTHFRGDGAITDLVVQLAERIDALRRAHLERFERPLRIYLLSDHGNTAGSKVRTPSGVGKLLRGAGLNPAKRLEGPDDVVAVTYGIVGYGVLFLDPSRAEVAARAMLGHPGVNLAAWVSDQHTLRVVGDEGEALVRWRHRSGRLELAHRATRGDPLRLADAERGMAAAGKFDPDGFASEADWFEATALGDYPAAPIRLVRSLDGSWVTNVATVIVSFAPGYAWGIRSAQLGAWFRGGKLEATHGGLDRGSTWGFYLKSDGPMPSGPAVAAHLALAELSDLASGADPALLGPGCDRSPLHAVRLFLP